MEAERFDRWTRGLGQALSRRRLAVGAAVLGLVRVGTADPAAADDIVAQACLPTGARCTRRGGEKSQNCKKCCTGVVTRLPKGRGRCACAPLGRTCTGVEDCCDATAACSEGICSKCAIECPIDQRCIGDTCVAKPCGEGGPCTVFVSSTARKLPRLGGVTGADAICNSLATAAGLRGTYLAWISTATVSPAERFYQSDTPYVRTDGAVVVGDWAELMTGLLRVPIDRDELGREPDQPVGDRVVATGTKMDGTPNVRRCDEWTNKMARGDLGNSNYYTVPGIWTFQRINRCNKKYRVYCFEQAAT